MIRNTVSQIKVVYSENPIDFQNQFNREMEILSDCNPHVEFNHTKGFCAYITYDQTFNIPDTIADEYHAEGIYFTCQQCPLRETVTDGRVKRVKCKHSSYGYAHLDHECCEVFYRRLQLGELEPMGEPKERRKDYDIPNRHYLAQREEYMRRRNAREREYISI